MKYLPHIAPMAYFDGEKIVVECFFFIGRWAFKIGTHKLEIPHAG